MSDISETPKLIDFQFRVELPDQLNQGRFYFLSSQFTQAQTHRESIAGLINQFPIIGGDDPIQTEISHWNNPAILIRQRSFIQPAPSIQLFNEVPGVTEDRNPYNPYFFGLFPHLFIFQHRTTLTRPGRSKEITDCSGIALVCSAGVFENSQDIKLLRTSPLFYMERQKRESLPLPSRISYTVQETLGGTRNGYDYQINQGSVIDILKRDGVMALSSSKQILPQLVLGIFKETWLFMFANKLGGEITIPRKLSDM